MAQKLIDIDGVGKLPFYKRKGSSSVRIRINGHDVRVTLPTWMPYSAATLYVQQKADWIQRHRQTKVALKNGSHIGKQHQLIVKRSDSNRYTARITDTAILATLPQQADIESKEAQTKLERYAQKALLIESEELIIPQVRDLAAQFKMQVNTVEIKNLKSRWGSCSNKQDLAFSLFLVQLPWECIDYVILHELAHTKEMNHSPSFWSLVESMEPNYKKLRTQLKSYSPHVVIQQP